MNDNEYCAIVFICSTVILLALIISDHIKKNK